MATKFIVPLQKIIKDFNLEVLYVPEDASTIAISSPEVNRPGLQLSGFFDYFDSQRVQILGKSEFAFLHQFDDTEITNRIDNYFSTCPPAVVITRNIEAPACMMDAAKAHKVSLLRTADGTSAFMAGLIAELNVELAPRVTRHGVLVEVYGEGILLLGESGVGKSETAIELVKRGHRLIADDAVEIRRVSAKTLVGSSPENIRHFMELRGVGIINARRLFGIGAVKMTEKINMIVQLEQWDATKVYDRMGMNEEYTDVLGVQVSSLTIPVKPGRNLAIIIEVAAMNNRQKRMGYNAAQELLEKLGMVEPDSTQTTDWGDF
ncbi:HPr(Ser) kinase/phosphatase [Anaerotruncus colihominis]|uniref:HPr kinase/phosphorylase n=1 Tax=Anaerotruncus colihominis TaxID=169435 RepID=A0A174NF59_9FIRM|nr:HPr(Ser) kinase/phosphatase [Anaerotruncus colihominis]MCQ4733403.1 HPr(Ser) kinase/phosphatase [Anaerotruncus colihominis]CUP46316.1 HPr kinase/phosphorylase [Anaerotruncus colihominis]HJF55367.1 HPr(Ser) kinase/phosphatase [Anaerotruncus colihominis]